MKHIATALSLLILGAIAWADSLPAGTWIERKPGSRTLIVEAAGAGRKLTYHGVTGIEGQTLTIVTHLDGKDAPVMVNGKPTGQTMAIREVDSRHAAAVIKFQAKEMGASKSEVSADGRVLTVENNFPGPDGKLQKGFEHWDKK